MSPCVDVGLFTSHLCDLSYFFTLIIIDHIQKQPPEVFFEKVVLRNFSKFTGKHLCQGLVFKKVAGLRQIGKCGKESKKIQKFDISRTKRTFSMK